MRQYNGRTCCLGEEQDSVDLNLYTDAAGSTGFGAILGNHWCAQEWPEEWEGAGLCRNLTLLELFPTVGALELWGEDLADKKVAFG